MLWVCSPEIQNGFFRRPTLGLQRHTLACTQVSAGLLTNRARVHPAGTLFSGQKRHSPSAANAHCVSVRRSLEHSEDRRHAMMFVQLLIVP